MFAFVVTVLFLFSLEITNADFLEQQGDGSHDVTWALASLKTPLLFKLTSNEISQCNAAASACPSCINSCNFSPGSWEIAKRNQIVSGLREVDRCHAEYLDLKAEIPDWCMNDEKEFFPVPGYVVTQQQCSLMSGVECTQKWLSETENDIRSGRLKQTDIRFKVASKARELARLMKSVEEYKSELDLLPSKIHEYENAKRRNLLAQAYKHLGRPEETQTEFAHPVFQDWKKISAENRRLDLFVSRNDIYMSLMENKFVRRETVDQIPAFLDAISQLKNLIHSKKADTEGFLSDIKEMSEKTAVFQGRATNLAYELTHERDVEGAIEFVDDELLKLFSDLRQERSLLNSAKVNATISKLKLISMLRRLVGEISKQQRQAGCNSKDLLSL